MPVIALLALCCAIAYFMTPEERTRVCRGIAAGPRRLGAAARLFRLQHDDLFYLALRARARVPIVTLLLLVANVGVFSAMVWSAGAVGAPETLIAWGANYGPRTTGGERWRVFTSVFLHGGFLHLCVTVAALAQVGSIVERLTGRLTFGVVYLAAGVLGSIVALAQAPLAVTVGPSAAIVSAYGMLFAAALRGALQPNALAVPLRAYRTLAPGAAIFAAYFLATETTYTVAKVGLCAGLAGGIVLTRVVPDRRTRVIRLAALTAATVVIVLMAAMAIRVVSDIRPGIAEVIDVERRTVAAYGTAIKRFHAGRTTANGLIGVIEGTIVPALQNARRRVRTFANVPAADERLVADTEQYLRLRQESWRLRAEGLRTANMGMLRQAERAEQTSLQVFDQVKSAFVTQ